MISILVYDSRAEELEMMKRIIPRAAAVMTDEKWQMDYFSDREKLLGFMKEQPLLDLTCYDVTPKGSIEDLERIRAVSQQSQLMIIADSTMSPLEYIRPTILASSLLLRPITSEQVESRLGELLHKLRRTTAGNEEKLVVDTREGRTFVPMSQIYYLEAREKKIYVRLKRQVLTFYDTLDHLEETLPELFSRCHRSFIVNRSFVRTVMLSKNMLVLEDGMDVPLSRKYKADFKNLSARGAEEVSGMQ